MHGQPCNCPECQWEREMLANRARGLRADGSSRRKWPENPPPTAPVEYRRGKPVVSKGCKGCHQKRK